MCDLDFDYTLTIEYERLSVEELNETLGIFYRSSSECFVDIENLAEEVIRRLEGNYRYRIRDEENKNFNKLVISTFETLKKISRFMVVPSPRIRVIYDIYRKYMYSTESPVTSPVVSPKIEMVQEVQEVRLPKIMKKAKRKKEDHE